MTMRSTDYALLSQDSYNDPTFDKRTILDGVAYQAFDAMNDPSTGFQATAYRRVDTGEVIIAYRGTEFGREPVHDGGVDAGMVLTGLNAQTPDSVRFTQRVMDQAREDAATYGYPLKVTVTGHSLGGTLAEINASRFGLQGETFNAYGAAGLLEGVPEGGHQVIDHVRAGDLVSAASSHFGEVRVYATEKDIDTLGHAGYRDDNNLLSPRNPIKATDFDAHAIDNFTPSNPRLGHSIIDSESQARYRAHEGMIDRYRNDVMDIRMGLSATWEVPKAIGEASQYLQDKVGDGLRYAGHVAGEVASDIEKGVDRLESEIREDAQAVGHAVSHAAQEVAETAGRVRDEVSRDLHAAGHAISEGASSAWHTLTHPSSLFNNSSAAAPRVDHPDHPDHQLFQQARDGVQKLDSQHQRAPDDRSDRLAASLTVAARQEGMQRIDHVLLSGDANRTYGVQGELGSPLKQVAEVDTRQAMATTVEHSSQALQQISQQNQLQQGQQLAEQQQTQQRQPASPPGP